MSQMFVVHVSHVTQIFVSRINFFMTSVSVTNVIVTGVSVM